MKALIVLLIAMMAFVTTGCLGGGGAGKAADTTLPSNPPDEGDDPITEDPVVEPDPEPELLVLSKIDIINATPSLQYNTSGTEVLMDYDILNEGEQAAKCTWEKIIPVQPGYPEELHYFINTLNGPCNSLTHSQNNARIIYKVTANNGETTSTYTWDLNWTDGSVNNPVDVVKEYPTENSVRVSDSKWFRVDRTDVDNDGLCQWDIDGTPVSSSCVWYEYTEDGSGDHTLTYTIDDGVNAPASVSWQIGPKATISSITPDVANLDSGESQTYTVSLDDPHSTGAMCEIKLDGSLVQAIGSCSYEHTNDNGSHEIEVDVVYDVGGSVRNSEPSFAYVAPKANATVSITSVHDSSEVFHYDVGEQTEYFTLTGIDDADGDAEITWYINGAEQECVADADCDYNNDVSKTGLRLNSYDGGNLRIKAVLSDGQYSDEHTFNVKLATPEVNSSAVASYRCNLSGTTFEVWGRGFEATDEWKIMDQNVTMIISHVAYDRVILKLPEDVLVGDQRVQITKGSAVVQSGFDFVTFTSGVCP